MSSFRCLWVEDNIEEILDVYNSLLVEDEWNVTILAGRSMLVDYLHNNSDSWDLVILDGRMDTEPSVAAELTGQNIILDLRSGRFGNWGKTVPLVLYSAIVDILERAKRFNWPEPKPEILSKAAPEREIYGRLREYSLRPKASAIASGSAIETNIALLFGTGRIALGLGVPFLSDCTRPLSTIVLGRYSSSEAHVVSSVARKSISKNDALVIKVGAKKYPAIAWYDGQSAIDLEKILSASSAPSLYVVLSNDDSVLDKLLSIASFGAISIGAEFGAVASRIQSSLLRIDRSGFPILALENDHNSVAKAGASASHVVFRPCVIDRICADIIDKSGALEVLTDSESYSIAFENFAEPCIYFERHPVAAVLESSDLVDFYRRRKLLVMNVLHWIIAVVRTYRVIASVKSILQLEAQLMNVISETASEARMYRMFGRLLATKLVRDTPQDVLRIIYGRQDLDKDRDGSIAINREFEYANATIKRSRVVPDALTRIIKSGSANVFKKYERTFEDEFVVDFHENTQDYMESLGEYYRWMGLQPVRQRTVLASIERVGAYTMDIRARMKALERQDRVK
jgi:hypothetical protein